MNEIFFKSEDAVSFDVCRDRSKKRREDKENQRQRPGGDIIHTECVYLISGKSQ